MPNIWHTKHKNGALLDVLNLKNYVTLLQYCLKYETVRTTIAKSNIIILLRFSLSSSTNISLSLDSISFLLSLSLSISSLSSLLKKVAQDHSLVLAAISPVLAVDLVASFSTTRHRSRCLMIQPLPPTSTALTVDLQISLNRVVGVRFGMSFNVGFGLAFWIDIVWVVGRGFGSVGLGF